MGRRRKCTGPIGEIRTDKGNHWIVSSLCVAQAYRHCGLATKMMKQLIRDMRLHDRVCILLNVDRTDDPAQLEIHDELLSFYGKLGFTILPAERALL